MIHKLAIDTSFPFVGRAITKAVVNSIYFTLVNTAVVQVRAEMKATADALDTSIDSIDAFNDLMAQPGLETESKLNREELGYTVTDPVEVGKLLYIIGAYGHKLLLSKASYAESPLQPGKYIPNVFDIPRTLNQTLEFMLDRTPKQASETLKEEAASLGIPMDRVQEVLIKQQLTQQQFLREHKADILAKVESMTADVEIPDDSEKALALAASAYDKLPAIQRLRLWSTIDQGLNFAKQNEFMSYTRGFKAGKDNADMLEVERAEVHKEVAQFLKKGGTRLEQEIDEAVQRGARRPELTPLSARVKLQQAA